MRPASAPRSVGRGSTFTIYLPQVEAPAAEARDPGGEQAGRPDFDGAGLRILVVEDNEDVGAFANQTLQDLGYVTVWTSNAREALERLESGEAPFDAVFSDVVMPGMNGVEFGKRVRSRYPAMPVLLTSGYSDALAEEGRHGFELLQKPYSVEELSRRLGDILASRTRAAPGA